MIGAIETVAQPAAVLDDPRLPLAQVLLGEDAALALAELVDPAGLTLATAAPIQVVYRPGRRLTVVYHGTIDGDDEPATRTLVLETGGRPPPGSVVLRRDRDTLAGWVFPHDPGLPGLAAALDPGRLGTMIRRAGAGAEIERVAVRSYRPRKRAVVEVTTDSHRLFLKAVPPSRIRDLQSLHRRIATALPVPRSLGWSPEGLILLEALPGSALSSATAEAPPAGAILDLIEDFPPGDVAVVSRAERVPGHASVLGALVPDRADDLSALMRAAAAIPPEDPVPVHGDLHCGQIMVEGGRLMGLVDVDTAGMGSLSDDLANLLAHLHGLFLATGSASVADLGSRLLGEFEARVDRTGLRLRVAAALVGYAPGPWLRQQPDWERAVGARLDAALAWLP